MSWVAELKAMTQKKARVYRIKFDAGMVSATQARDAPTSNCITTIQNLFVRSMSTSGLQRGLITQGR